VKLNPMFNLSVWLWETRNLDLHTRQDHRCSCLSDLPSM